MSEVYYLSSLESEALSPVRKLHVIKRLQFRNTGKECLWVEVEEPMFRQEGFRSREFTRIVLSSRHEGDELPPEGKMPCFVHVATFRREDFTPEEEISVEDLLVIGWGEIYPTADAARHHTF